MTDLAETIATWRRTAGALTGQYFVIEGDELRALLDAAEAGMQARVMEEGLRAILNAPLPPPIGPAHKLRNIARRTLSRLVPVQGSGDVGFTLSTPEVDRARDAALEEAAKVCDDAASMAPSTEYGGGFTDGVTWAAANIRALRSPK